MWKSCRRKARRLYVQRLARQLAGGAYLQLITAILVIPFGMCRRLASVAEKHRVNLQLAAQVS